MLQTMVYLYHDGLGKNAFSILRRGCIFPLWKGFTILKREILKKEWCFHPDFNKIFLFKKLDCAYLFHRYVVCITKERKSVLNGNLLFKHSLALLNLLLLATFTFELQHVQRVCETQVEPSQVIPLIFVLTTHLFSKKDKKITDFN